MRETQAIFVVVPAFNEHRVIRETVGPLVQAGYTVVAVDDGSSQPIAVTLCGLPVTVIRHLFNLGQGAALQTGMQYAYRHGAEVIVHFDADGQHDPEQIPQLVAPLKEGSADIVLGSRFLRRADSERIPPTRRFTLRVGRIISGLLTGVWLTDTHNGFRALSRKAAGSIILRENDFAHATEILLQIRRAGLRYAEVPTTVHYSEYSRAKGQKASNSFRILFDLIVRKLLP